jgi:hypothetical protein
MVEGAVMRGGRGGYVSLSKLLNVDGAFKRDDRKKKKTASEPEQTLCST